MICLGKWDNLAASEGILNSGTDVGHVPLFCYNIKRLEIQMFWPQGFLNGESRSISSHYTFCDPYKWQSQPGIYRSTCLNRDRLKNGLGCSWHHCSLMWNKNTCGIIELTGFSIASLVYANLKEHDECKVLFKFALLQKMTGFWRTLQSYIPKIKKV